MLPKEAITEFKALYKKRYCIELSDEEASFKANNLVDLYATVYGVNKEPDINCTPSSANYLSKPVQAEHTNNTNLKKKK